MPLALNDLRREVLRCAAERPRAIRQFLGEAEVCDLQMAISREQQVFWLQVSVDDVASVEVF